MTPFYCASRALKGAIFAKDPINPIAISTVGGFGQ